MAKKIYADIADYLNKVTFECIVYGGYTDKRVPQYYKDFPDLKPIFVSPDGASKTRITISRMIGMFRAGEPFMISNQSDIVDISGHIGTYISEYGPIIIRMPDDAPAVDFLGRCKAFLADLEVHKDRAKRIIRNKSGVVEENSAADMIALMMGG